MSRLFNLSSPAAIAEPSPEPDPFAGSSLEFLRAIYSDPRQTEARRMRAAIAALPFEHPKLAVTASIDAGPGFAARLEDAFRRSRLVLEPTDGGVADPEGSGNVGQSLPSIATG